MLNVGHAFSDLLFAFSLLDLGKATTGPILNLPSSINLTS